ncbi:MAG TPA: DEAD/DEAH box helicase [Devosia sp.]|jgi:hypothetical protein|uniref:DEAD/DEAH box helicase n=1 Tax=Devosia sp. TaxID=1871048 RepID=UPI002F935283
MSIANIDWPAVRRLRGIELKGEVFSIISEASRAVQTLQADDPDLLAVVPRLAELIDERPELQGYREIHSSLARAVGLWNYIDQEIADKRDRFIAASSNVERLGLSLHREQVAALNSLLSGRNLILSAPTSFGKSILVDALILSGKFNRVAIVLPTIALLDEFRRRITKRFGDEYDVLMHHSEKATRQKVVYLGTQERLINRTDLGSLDIVVVDEFYKLDPSRRDDRSITLNAAVYRLLSHARQFFFLGPNIDNVTLASDTRWRFEFLRTRFSTVAVDTINLGSVPDKDQRLKKEAFEPKNWPALIFVSAPDRANALAAELTPADSDLDGGRDLASWMGENFGTRWPLIKAVAAGIGVHHGRIPKALASKFIRLFNDGDLPVLLCTSTLIEGVNTAAKSVMIYDKKIDGRPYDFFTFSNIRGRAGRLGQHHVGQVYLFHKPPEEADVDVDAPLFGDWEEAPDDYVIHIEEQDSSPAIDSRVEELSSRSGLSIDSLRRFSSIGVDVLIELRGMVAARLRRGVPLSWQNWPEYKDVEAVCEVISHFKKPQDMGRGSYKQVAKYLAELRSAPTLKAFFHWHFQNYKGDEERVDGVFKFLRAVEYSLPEFFAAVEAMTNVAGGSANYGLYLAQMPRWFRADALKMLEEQGVPMQISERFLAKDDTVKSLGERLTRLAAAQSASLTSFEREWILQALP